MTKERKNIVIVGGKIVNDDGIGVYDAKKLDDRNIGQVEVVRNVRRIGKIIQSTGFRKNGRYEYIKDIHADWVQIFW